jgi:RHS repeat-associated protein
VYLWQNGQIVLQFDKSGTGDLDYEDLSHRYLWGPTVDMLLADEQIDWSDTYADGEVLWALTDHLGSVRDVIDNDANLRIHREIDSYGNVLDSSHFDAAGDPVSETDPGFVSVAFIYTGKLFDTYTSLQYNNARWYDLATGGWISEDFIWDGYNKGTYVGNTPTMFVDPSGLEKLPPFADEQISPKIYIRTDKGPQVYGGFEVHVYDKHGDELAKLKGNGGWCKTHGNKALMKPSAFAAKYGDEAKKLKVVLRREAKAAAENGWRTGSKLNKIGAARIGATVIAVYGIGMQAADAMEAVAAGRGYKELIKRCEAGDLRGADSAAKDIEEELLRSGNAYWALGWNKAWDTTRKELAKEIDEIRKQESQLPKR